MGKIRSFLGLLATLVIMIFGANSAYAASSCPENATCTYDQKDNTLPNLNVRLFSATIGGVNVAEIRAF